MIKEEIIRIVSGLGLLALSQLIPYDNPQKDEGVRAFYFIIYGLLASIGLFLLTMTMGDVTLFWVSFPPFIVIVPLGTLWLIKKIAEQSNDKKFKDEALSYDNKFKNYFTSWWDLIKNIFLDIWSLPLNIWSLFIYYAVEFLKIIRMPFDAVYDGLVSVSGAAGDSVNASFDGIKNGLEEIRRYFKVLFVDALWEIVSLGGQICCSILPPPFNKSTKCAKQTNCMSKTKRQNVRDKIIQEAEAEARGIISRAGEAAREIERLSKKAAAQLVKDANLAADSIRALARGDYNRIITNANAFYASRVAAAKFYAGFLKGKARAIVSEAEAKLRSAEAEARRILSDVSQGDFSRILGYTKDLPQIIAGANNYMLMRATKGDGEARRWLRQAGLLEDFDNLPQNIKNDLASGDVDSIGRSLVRVGNIAWDGAEKFVNDAPGWVKNNWDGIKNGTVEVIDGASGAVKNITEEAGNEIKKGWDTATSWIPKW
jgi:vacuolar-type H+-ATPase subunit H